MKKSMVRLISVLCVLAFLLTAIPVSAESLSSTTDSTASVISGEKPSSNLPDDADIVGEIESLRDANTKFFRRTDGLLVAAIYNNPIHYHDGYHWKEINNTLISAEVKNGVAYYKNTANSLQVQIPSQATSPVVVENGEYSLQWTLLEGNNRPAVVQNASTQAESAASSVVSTRSASGKITPVAQQNNRFAVSNRSSAVTYAQVYDNVDVRYDVIGNTLKESIILEKPTSQPTFAFMIQAAGLTAVLQEDRSVHFYEPETAEPVFVVEAPYMFDAADEYSQAVAVTLTPVTGGYRYIISPSRNWLLDSKRVYPVTIDPTVQTDIDRTAIDTARVYSQNPDSPNQQAHLMYAGTMLNKSGVPKEYRGLVRFNMPNTTALGLGNVNIVEARLVLTKYLDELTSEGGDNYHLATSTQINLHRIKESWDELAVTWNNQPDYDALVSDYRIETQDEYQSCYDITELAVAWAKGEYANYGVLLKTNALATTSNAACWFSDDISGTYAEYRPSAFITYRDCSGIEDYWTYTTLSVGRGVSVMTNNATGNLVAVLAEGGTGGNRMPVSLSRVYNTNTEFKGPYGGRWRMNFQASITPVTDQELKKTYPYYYTDPDGTDHYFYKNNNVLQDEDGLGLTLTVNNSSTTARYVLKDKGDNVLKFDNQGKLLRQEDTNGNYIAITYKTVDGKVLIDTITDGAGRVYTFGYNTYEQLTSITDPANRKYQYVYNAAGELWKATTPDGNLTNFHYTSNRLTTVTGNGQRLTITYDTAQNPVRVKSMKLDTSTGTVIGAQYTFDYGKSCTNICEDVTLSDTNEQNKRYRKYTYQFNNYMQTVCVVNHTDGSGKSYAFGKPGLISNNKGVVSGTENKVLFASDTQKSVVNYLSDSRFDTSFVSNGSYSTSIAAGQVGTVTWDSTYGRTGKGSIKASRTSIGTATNPYFYAQQNKTVPKNGYYVLSGYVSTNGVHLTPGPGVLIRLERWRNGEILGYAQANCNETAANDWVHLSTSLECAAGDTLKVLFGTNGAQTLGTMWIDDVQLEYQEEGASTHNLLHNTSFENGKNGWTQKEGTWTVVSNAADADGYKPAKSTYAIQANGAASTCARLTQSITVSNGKKGDAYSAGCWAKGNAVELDPDASEDNNRDFAISVEFYNGTTLVGSRRRMNFNHDYNNWQFVSGEAVATGAYNRVDVVLEYTRQANTAQFTLPYLYRDGYGQSYTYDKNGNVVSATDQENVAASYTYSNNNLGMLANPSGSEVFASYDDTTHNLLSTQSTNGQRIEYTYDSHGNPTKAVVGTDTFATSLTPGVSYYIRNAKTGNVLDMANIVHNDLCEMETWKPNDSAQQFVLMATGTADVYNIRPATNANLRIDLEGNTDAETSNIQVYNTNGSTAQMFKIVRTDSHSGTFLILTRSSNYAKCVDERTRENATSEDDTRVSQRTRDQSLLGQEWYFIEAKPSLSTDAYIMTEATYSSNGNYVATATDELGNVTLTDTNANSGLTNHTIAPNGTKTSYTYDGSNTHLTGASVSDADGNLKSRVTYSQNTATDTLTSILSGSDTLYRFTYDGLGRTESTRLGTDSSGRLLASYLYDGSTGALQQLTYGNGHTLTYEYDALGRILRKTPTNSAQRSEYVYNDKGRLGILKDYASDTRTKYLYDLAGRVTGVLRKRYVNNDNGWRWGEILYRYEDGTNHLTKLEVRTDYKSYATNFVYGNIAAGQMPDSVYEVKLNNAKEIEYTYDGLGRLTSRKLSVPNLTATYGYKTVSGNRTSTQLQSVTTAAGATAYTYDSVGNITAVTNNGTATESYTYDALNQLTAATMGGMNYAYTYDAGGNILTASAGNTTHSYTYGDSVWKDLLTAYDGNPITYDTIGNPLTYYDGTTFTWQNGRELAGVTKDGVTSTYVYNADGGRHTKTVGGVVTQYVTVDGVLYVESTGSNTLVYYYDEAGTPYAFTHNNVKYYYEYNLMGDVIGLFDSAGTRVVQYTYTPYGALASMTDSTATGVGTLNPIRYRGYYYDTETGFYYCNSRYYDPEIGRWINADGVISGSGQSVQGYNLFEYCNNNPVNKSDSTGAWPKWIKNAASAITKAAKKVASVATKAAKKVASVATKVANSIKTTFSPANHVQKTHVTTPTAMLNLGTLFGKVGFSSTVTKQNKEPGLVHSASDIGNDASKYSAGINIVGWLGADVGVSSEINAFVSAQATPWVHGELSLGVDGIGAVIGFDIGDISYDFEINGGWGLIAIFVSPEIVASGGQPIGAPAY